MRLPCFVLALLPASVAWGQHTNIVNTNFPAPYNSEPAASGSPPAAAEAAKRFELPKGFQISVFASEPDVQNPIGMAWDNRGRLWVAENYTYAERGRKFERALRDRVVILEDTDQDGRHDTRKVFTDASIKAAEQWKFTPPAKGEDVDESYWTVRVPVDYIIGGRKAGYGEWEAYVPGPRQSIPWEGLRDMPSFSPDTMVADGSVYQTGKGLRLLTPLQGG